MMAEQTGSALAHDAAGASLRVVESAVALARAEAKLVVVRARTLFIAALVLMLGVVVAVSFAQLTLILLALAPLFVASGAPLGLAPQPFFVALGVAVCLLLLGGGCAWWGFKRLGERAPQGNDGGEA
jgi:hypothetical protein